MVKLDDAQTGQHLSLFLSMVLDTITYTSSVITKCQQTLPPNNLSIVCVSITEQVEGSLGAWTYILMWISPQHLQPALTLGSVSVVLPVAHKYGFTALVRHLVATVDCKHLCPKPADPNADAIKWLIMAENLGLCTLEDVCWEALESWSGQELRMAVMGGEASQDMRPEVELLSQNAVCKLLELAYTR
eukprot:361614-Chlamydomonas_euryale.AAC.5